MCLSFFKEPLSAKIFRDVHGQVASASHVIRTLCDDHDTIFAFLLVGFRCRF